MRLVAGLGNPGRQYAGTRHNVGFAIVDELAQRWKIDATRFDRDFEAQIGDGTICGVRTLLLRPMTYMNRSGRSVAAAQRFYKLPLEAVLIVADDLDLPPGKIRLRAAGSSGGQRGLADVLAHLGTQDVARLRFGIGKVHRAGTVDHVLSGFTPQEREAVEPAIRTAADAVECWIAEGITAAMNRFNRDRKDEDD